MSFVAGGMTEPNGGATAMIGATGCVPKKDGAACGSPKELTPGEGVGPNNPVGPGGLAPNDVGPNVPNPPEVGAPNTGGVGAGLLPNVPNPVGAGVLPNPPNPPRAGVPTKWHGNNRLVPTRKWVRDKSSKRELTKGSRRWRWGTKCSWRGCSTQKT